jgi:parvulin-like peptidyl-prolyl isomerase
VAQVGPDSITASQLLSEVRPSVRSLDAQAKQLGGGANSTQITQYIDQQKRGLPDQTLNSMIDQHIIQQEAGRRGISIAPSDLDDRERQTAADFQSSTNPSPTPEPASTPEAAITAEPTVAPTAAVGTTPTAIPTLEQPAYASALQQLLDRNNLTETELRDKLQQGMLREKVQTAVGQDKVPDTQEQVHAQQIIVASQDQAAAALTQLQGGADFAQLAQQLSTDAATKDKGGDLGWVWRGVITDKALEDAAFSMQPGQLSDVVQTTTGYGVIQVLERDPARALPADQLQTQRQKAASDWLDSSRTGKDVKLQLTQPERDWILTRIGIRP